MKEVTLAFVFDHNMENVLLIHNRPDKKLYGGLWNGLGGKVEDADMSPAISMCREVKEETMGYLDLSDPKDVSKWRLVQVVDFVAWDIKMYVNYAILNKDYPALVLGNLENSEGRLDWWKVEDAIEQLHDERGIPHHLLHILTLEGKYKPLWVEDDLK